MLTVTYSVVQGWDDDPVNNVIGTQDPLFVNAAAGNLHLQPGSPAIDTGTDTGAPAFDLDGLARPQDGDGSGTAEFDMGAYEYVPSAPVDITLQAGWNLVAGAPGTDFGGDIFGWNGTLRSYHSTTDPHAWQGYWRKASGVATVAMHTDPGPTHEITLAEGWNLIGNPMATTATLTMPPTSLAFVYYPLTGYATTTTLEPGQGAWVRGVAGEMVVLTGS